MVLDAPEMEDETGMSIEVRSKRSEVRYETLDEG